MEVESVDLKGPELAGGEAVANMYCVILGRIGTDPLTVVGSFAAEDQAQAHADEHLKSGAKSAIVDILVNPANC